MRIIYSNATNKFDKRTKRKYIYEKEKPEAPKTKIDKIKRKEWMVVSLTWCWTPDCYHRALIGRPTQVLACLCYFSTTAER